MTWTIEFQHKDRSYVWEGEIQRSVTGADLFLPGDALNFVRERLALNGKTIVQRQNGTLILNDNPIPQLRGAESVLSLFTEDANVTGARHALLNVAFISGNELQHNGSSIRDEIQRQSLNSRCVEWTNQRLRSSIDERFVTGAIAALFDAGKDSAAVHAFFVKQVFPERFTLLKEHYCDIFPSVVDVTVDFANELRNGGSRLVIQLAIKERGYDQWILQPEVSSGMLRTLFHLFAIDAAMPGSVIIVDEFENSLGENCLSHMTDSVQQHIGEVQFILTSHHPYVIHNIPVDCWQLVRRRGSTVTLTSARDIPALMSKSHHDAFIRLLNLKEFQEGIEIADTTGNS